MKYLLDTNVLSEGWKRQPDANVLAWLEANEADYLIAAPVVAEIVGGVENAEDSKRGELQANVRELLADHAERIATFDGAAAEQWGLARYAPELKRQPQPLFDSLIEAIALARGLVVVTRDTGGFRLAETLNPWLKDPA